MQNALMLDEAERLRFMRALYSIFWRDENVNALEQCVLEMLDAVFGVSTGDYKHFVYSKAAGIAGEINKISDVRARIYFMRIIHDVYLEEIKVWFNGPESDHAVKFRRLYADLTGLVNVGGVAP